MLGGQTGPFLKKLPVGSESANKVYLEKVDVYNMYAMSESGFAVGIFLMPSMLIADSTSCGILGISSLLLTPKVTPTYAHRNS